MTDDPRLAAESLARTRSVTELVSKLVGDLSDLVLKETELIRAEMNEKVTQLQAGVGKMAAGGVVMLVALIVFADALVVAVAGLLGTAQPGAGDTLWASLIVGGLFGLVGAFLLRSGAGDLKPVNLKPDRTATQVRRDTDLAKDSVR